MPEKSDGITESKGFDGSVDRLLDTKGLNCPMPLLKAKQALNRMDVGQILEVISTDQGSVRDFQVFACLLYTSPSPRDKRQSRMPSSA